MMSLFLSATKVSETFGKTVVDEEPEGYDQEVRDDQPDEDFNQDDENPDLVDENQDDENPDLVDENQDDENPDLVEENQDDENPDLVDENQDDENDPNNKEYTNDNDTLGPDKQPSDETDNNESKENPIQPNREGENASSDAKGPATEQTDGPPDALKDATAKQQWEGDDARKTASETFMETKQQMEKTPTMASDTYKDMTQQMEKTQKMASDAYKDTTQQMEKTQKMASDKFKDANKVMGTSNKPFVTSNKNNNAAAVTQKPQQKPQGTGQQQSQGTPQQKPQGQGQQRSQGKPQQKPQGLGLQESQEEQQPMESGPTPQPPQKPQTLQKPLQKAQQRQPPPLRKQSASPTQTQQPPQESKVSYTPPQPETQTQARSTSLVPEKMPSPSGGVVPTTPTAEEDAANIFRALKGSGCDVGRLVQILSNHDPNHRHEIARHYRNNYNEELSDCICSGLSTSGKGFLKEKVGLDLSINATGSLGWLCKDIKRAVSLWLLKEPERDANIVWQSLQLTSMDKAALTEVICSRTPAQICNLKRVYFNKFKSELSKDIDSSTLLIASSNTKALLIACLDNGARDEGTNVDLKMADKDATQLYIDGEKIWGTNNKTFIDIFTKRNRPHLAAVDAAYDRLYGHSLEEAVRKETSRSFQAGLLTLLKCAKNPAKYFAEVLYNSMKGLGTSDTTLIRVVVTRAGIDMEDIKEEYVKAYKTSLKDSIHKDTSGDYRTFLLNLVE